MLRGIRRFFHYHLLLFVLFLTGASVLIIEIVATRLLSVYFGNTIYAISSIISVILLALSFGYFMGGRLADRRGSEFLFYQVVSLSGLSIFLLLLLNIYIIPQITTQFSLREGPLVSSMILFLLPGILLGMLSPIVARVQKNRAKQEGIGQITGDVFFWSTMGSLVGSLGSGFYLIPQFGVNEIIMGVGAVLFGVGLLGMLIPNRPGTSSGKLVVLLLTLPILYFSLEALGVDITRFPTLFQKQGLYDNITIFDGTFYGVKTRFLQQATDASSAMYLPSDELVYDYTKYYSVYKLITKKPERALVIGGGAYSVPKALLLDDKNVKVDVAEIEPDLFTLGQKYFRVPNDKRLKNHVEDGRRLLLQTEDSYNLIFSDAFHFTIPAHLATKEFFELAKSKLKPEGVFVANIVGNLHGDKDSFLFSEIKTFQEVFPNSYFFAVDSTDSDQPQNVIMVGYNGDPGRNLLTVDTDEPFLATLALKRIDLASRDLSSYPIFTDNYAPVEYFIGKELTRTVSQ